MGDHTAFFYGKPSPSPSPPSSRPPPDSLKLTKIGTLMAPGVLYRVIYGTPTPQDWQKNLTTFHPALLPSFRRHRVKNAHYPGIIPHVSSTDPSSVPSSVRGSYVTGLTEGDIYRLDIFEGEQYQRQKVRVQILDDKIGLDEKVDEKQLNEKVVREEEVETYVWIAGEGELEDSEWDFEEFKKEKMRAWMGLDVGDEVKEDGGFADVERAVNGDGGGKDPSGGRINGVIIRELERAAV